MCTSFVIHADRSYIGMNFDISPRPIQLSLKNKTELRILQKEAQQFLPAFGINREGCFMNLQMVAPDERAVYRRAKNSVHIIKLFDIVLANQVDQSSLAQLLEEKIILNVPNISVQSLITQADRSVRVLEPALANLSFPKEQQPFVALTNFRLSEFQDQPYSATHGDGAERYQTCCSLLEQHQASFSLEQGFAVLAATAQQEGEFPTQLSMLALPEDGLVYFAVGRDYTKLFEFSFATGLLQSFQGFTKHQQHDLSKTAASLEQLAAW